MLSSSPRCMGASGTEVDAASRPTNYIGNATTRGVTSNLAAAPRRIIVDDPPTREPGTKKRARFLAGFGLVIISVLVLIVGVSFLRAFRQR